MLRFLLPGFLVLALASEAQIRPAAKPAAKPAPPLSAKQLVIKEPCAVLYWPDEAKIERLKKKGNEEGFYTVADDNMYYVAQSREYLKKHKIKSIDSHAGTFRFVPVAGPAFVLDRRADKYSWGLILFDGRHAPREADLVEPAADVKAVFKK